MVFSIFRKKDPHTDAETGDLGPDSMDSDHDSGLGEANPPSTISPLYGSGDMGIEVSGSNDTLTQAEEQAAMSYASGAATDAIEVLTADLPNVRGQHRLETWLMLFELYQQTNNRSAFDNLGLDFVVEFEKTPPIWFERGQKAPAPGKGKSAATGSGNQCAFGAKLLAETISKELLPFNAKVKHGGAMRVDFGRVTAIDNMAAAELLAAWQMARKPGSMPQVLGAQTFIPLLQSKIEAGRSEPSEVPFWMLLTELYQALGQQDNFETLAVDYAVTFEVSPPSWDPRLAPKEAAPSPAVVAEPEANVAAAEPNADGLLVLPGSLTSQNTDGLALLREFAQEHPGHEMTLDFLWVDRVDFDSAGQLLNLFMGLMQQGNTVSMIRVNELVLAMLRIMGITEMASAERRRY